MAVFIHCADFHIDSPFSKERAAQRAQKRAALVSSFIDMTEYIKREGVRLCLICGDLFDCPEPSEGAFQTVLSAMRDTPSCRFFISPGNHDPYIPGGIWDITMPENVRVFKSAEPQSVEMPEEGVRICGFACLPSTSPADPTAHTVLPDDALLNIIMGHANTDTAEDGVYTLRTADLAQTASDYIALGHIHASRGGRTARGEYFYPGCVCGRDFGECGKKGVYLVNAEKGTVKKELLPSRAPVYYNERLDITDCSDFSDISDAIARLISDRGIDKEDCLRLTLCGAANSDMHIETELLAALCGTNAEITDLTTPTKDIAALERAPGLRGEFVRTLMPQLGSDDADIRETAEEALRLGLAAIDGRKIDEI